MNFMNVNIYSIATSGDIDPPPTPWAAIDTETGGLDCIRHALLTVAVWTPDHGADRVYVQLDGDVTPEALAKNRIDLGDCVHGCTPDYVGKWLAHRLRGRAIVAHCLPFDLGFLGWRIYRIPPTAQSGALFGALRLYDTQQLARLRWPDEPHDLPHVAELCGIEVDAERLHSAEYDAELCGRVFQWMLQHPTEGE